MSLLAISDPEKTAILLLILGVLCAAAVLSSRFADRFGVPVVLLFLILGMLGGSEGLGGIVFENFHLAERIGTLALVMILFQGGLGTQLRHIRHVLLPATLLATMGVALTAGLVTLFAHLLGMPWGAAALLGAVVSSTDAAAVFSVLGSGPQQLTPRIKHLLELESCMNDPVAVIATTAVIGVLTASEPLSWHIALNVPVQLVVGTAIGATIGLGAVWLLLRARLTTAGLYPVLTAAAAMLSYGVSTVCGGSGFLAVFTTGLVLGNADLPFQSAMLRIHDVLGWLGQVTMFLMLGLLVTPSQLKPIVGMGLAIAAFLAIVARPVAVALCLLPLKYRPIEIVYVGWNGLRGAVPIVLATFPVLAGVAGAYHVFNLVFFIVVINSIIPGTTIRPVTRWLGLTVPGRPRPMASLQVNSTYRMSGELTSYLIEPIVAVCDAAVRDVDFPDGASVILVIRGEELFPARGSTVLRPGDHAYVFHLRRDRGAIQLLFGAPEHA